MSGSIVMGLPQSPRPGAWRVRRVLRQALVEQRLDVGLVPALRLVLPERHLLLAGRQVVPCLRRDLVGRGQVHLVLLRGAHHVRPVASCLLLHAHLLRLLHRLRLATLWAVLHRLEHARLCLRRLGAVLLLGLLVLLLRVEGGCGQPLLLLGWLPLAVPLRLWRRARDLAVQRLQVGRLGLITAGGAATRDVLAHHRRRQGVHVAAGAEHLLVLGPVSWAAQAGEQGQVLVGRVLLLLLDRERLLLAAQPLGVLLLLGGLGLLPLCGRGAWSVVLAVHLAERGALAKLLLVRGEGLLASFGCAPGAELLGEPLLGGHRVRAAVHARQASLIDLLLPRLLRLLEGDLLVVVLEHALLIGVRRLLLGRRDGVLDELRVVVLIRFHGLASHRSSWHRRHWGCPRRRTAGWEARRRRHGWRRRRERLDGVRIRHVWPKLRMRRDYSLVDLGKALRTEPCQLRLAASLVGRAVGVEQLAGVDVQLLRLGQVDRKRRGARRQGERYLAGRLVDPQGQVVGHVVEHRCLRHADLGRSCCGRPGCASGARGRERSK